MKVVLRALTVGLAAAAVFLPDVRIPLGNEQVPPPPNLARVVPSSEAPGDRELLPPMGELPGPSPTPGTPAAPTREARWMKRIDRIAGGPRVSICVGEDATLLFQHRGSRMLAPASNEKLVLSMALLDTFGPGYRIPTRAEGGRVSGDVVRGDLWVVGAGDPTITGRDLAALARRISRAGVRRIGGSVMGGTTPFRHDWDAPGWKRRAPIYDVALPTALTIESNTARGRHVAHPEHLAAEALTKELRERGVHVAGKPGAGRPPKDLEPVARIRSPRLSQILTVQNRNSVNFHAEVLNKLLGMTEYGAPGTIAKGARAIGSWAAARGVEMEAHDGSGLSYDDRVSTLGLVELMWAAGTEPWGRALRRSLAAGGQGTLRYRLTDVRVRAKTGTLEGHSALSGWVWLRRDHHWAEFSILSRGLPKSKAIRIENRVVRILARSAHA